MNLYYNISGDNVDTRKTVGLLDPDSRSFNLCCCYTMNHQDVHNRAMLMCCLHLAMLPDIEL